MEILLVCGVLVVMLLVVGGIAFNGGSYLGGGVAILAGIFFLVAVVASSDNYFGEVRALGGKIFVVEAKVVDSAGKKAYLLYDLEQKKNRAAIMETYPPAGYKEIMTTDGTVLLTPIPGK